MSDPDLREAARLVLAARDAGRALEPLPERCRPRTLADGYAIQAALHALLDERGTGPVAGFKIGCTSPVMQQFLGIAHPCAGRMRARDVATDAVRVALADHVRIGIEAELAVTLGGISDPMTARSTASGWRARCARATPRSRSSTIATPTSARSACRPSSPTTSSTLAA